MDSRPPSKAKEPSGRERKLPEVPSEDALETSASLWVGDALVCELVREVSAVRLRAASHAGAL